LIVSYKAEVRIYGSSMDTPSEILNHPTARQQPSPAMNANVERKKCDGK